jgi:hypothetical protein
MLILKRLGYKVAITEKWNPHAKIRQDAWGFIDLIAVKFGHKPIFLQVTSWPNTGARVKKIRELGAPIKKPGESGTFGPAHAVIGTPGIIVEVWGFKPGLTLRSESNLKRVRLCTSDRGVEIKDIGEFNAADLS